jgi:hydroxylamine reductase (hybrid-cluster protein)
VKNSATRIPWAIFVINLGCAKSGVDDTDFNEIHGDPGVMSFF